MSVKPFFHRNDYLFQIALKSLFRVLKRGQAQLLLPAEACPWKGFAIKSKSFNRPTEAFSMTRASFQMYLKEPALSNGQHGPARQGQSTAPGPGS